MARAKGINYPFISLKVAIDRVRELYKMEGTNVVNAKLAARHWGYKEKSSGGLRTVAALSAFGLVEVSGKGSDRSIKISRLARNIILDEREDSSERDEHIKTTATKPKIFNEMWQKWSESGLPSDANITYFLMSEKEVNKTSASDILKKFKETISFANLIGFKPEDEEKNEATEGKTTDTDISEDPLPELPTQKTEMRQDSFSLDEGQAIIQFPKKLSKDSYEDFEVWLELIKKKAKRSVQNKAEDQ